VRCGACGITTGGGFEDHFGLLDDSFALLFAHLFCDEHFLAAANGFFFVEFLALAGFYVGGESDDGAASELFEIFGGDTAGDIAD
jgi:hypothetical protein